MNRTNRIVLLNAGAVVTTAALAASLMVMSSSRAQGTLPQRSYLPLSDAVTAAQAALDSCETGGYNVTVAIVDRSGNVQVHLRGDDAGVATITGSERKAFTAAAFGRPSSAFTATQALRDLDDRIALVGGGLPIRFDGELVGGIGVGGAPSGTIDETCAADGLAAINADSVDDATGTPDATGTVDTTGTPDATGTVDLTGTPEVTSTVDITGTPDATGTVDLTGTPEVTSTVDITGTLTPEVTGTVDTTGTPDATGTVETTGTATVSATGTVTGTTTP